MITYPLNNVQYTAEDAELFHSTRTSGVFAGTDFQITADGVSSIVTVGEGIGWIRNTRFSGKVVASKSTEMVDLGVADSVYPRIDAVVIQFDANQNKTSIVAKQGTAATSPQPPVVVRTETLYELHLCHVFRFAGSAAVTSGDITDLRLNPDYCGLMVDDVTDLVSKDIVLRTEIGVAGGLATLNSSGKVPSAQLPSLDFIPTSQKAAAGGVASLDNAGTVPVNQIPALNYIPEGDRNGLPYIPTSQKGTANGVASLGADGKVPSSQMPEQTVDLSGYVPKSGATMTGRLTANTNYDYTTYQVQNTVVLPKGSLPTDVTATSGTMIYIAE